MKIKRIIYIGCLLLLTGFYCQAQKETWNWAFGNKAGLSFHPDSLRSFAATGIDGTPNATLDNLPGTFKTSIVVGEGVFSISDKNGNLLFYSSGIKIWKADGTEIYAGLGGSSSSPQSGIVVPYPGDEKKYICIGLAYRFDNRMNYVVVQANSPTDVSVTGSLTDFSGHTGYLGESMTAIRHGNGQDWWIVAPGKGNPMYFNAWLATPAGVEASAPEKITNSGIYVSAATSNGYFKFTPDGKHFVYATWEDKKFIYGDFDDWTGEFSNIRMISGGRYGVEFSPNQKYLYLSATDNMSPPNGVFVWDFEALLQGTATTPVKEITVTNSVGALQQDLFGRIWGTFPTASNSMLLIENADEPENMRIYRLEHFLLYGTNAYYGLPSFSSSWFYVSGIQADSEIFCANTLQSFSVNITKGSGVNELAKTEWDFGDGSPVITDTNVNGTQTHSHTYAKRGRYTITVKCFLKSDGSEVTARRQTLDVKVNSCRLPVNHNITTMGY